MTASVMRGESARCFDVGMNDFIGKPVDPEHLEAVLAAYLTER